MQRTFNYTNRQRIEKNEALFSFTESNGDPPEFNVQFKFDTKAYPDDARLYIEAHHKETRQRFEFGTVSSISPPKNRRLEAIDLSGSIQFSIMIVDESGKHGLLLASGRGFKADANDNGENDRSSILTVKAAPLGQLPWKVEIERGMTPELYLNNSIPNSIEMMRGNPVFQSLILPAALREILTFYLWNEDDESDEAKQWFSFASTFAEDKPESEDPSETLAWVDTVVADFASRFDLCDRLVNDLREEIE